MQEMGWTSGQDWLEQLDEADVEFVIVDPHSDAGLLRVLRLQVGWTVDFEDAEAVVFAAAGSAMRDSDKLAVSSW